MHNQTTQHPNETAAAVRASFPDAPPPPPVFTVEQFAERNPAFTAPAIRNLVFKADTRHSSRGPISGNGLLECGAIIRIGRKVLIDETKFFDWVRQQGGRRI
jgi:hypothetical protein